MFGVKYYIEDPSVFKEDITRYQYVLQLCQDIKDQRCEGQEGWGRGGESVRMEGVGGRRGECDATYVCVYVRTYVRMHVRMSEM